jgi:hypothetical protein
MPIVRAMTRTLRPTTHAARPALLRLGVGAFSAVHNLRRRGMFRTLHVPSRRASPTRSSTPRRS